MKSIDAFTLKSWIHDGEELVLLDVREHGEYGENHLFFATSVPYSVLELKIPCLAPRKAVRVALYGDAEKKEVVTQAAQALSRLGYSHVSYLDGGIQAWQKAGYGTFAGVNLPSKTFGEIAEHALNTPSISAKQLYELQQNNNKNYIVLDGRPVEEYQKMNIPGAICCPNGELALRFDDLVEDDETIVVINCAGRTRSIIGAQTLINLKVPNPVYALENGTQGWYLEGFNLEHNSGRFYPEKVNVEDKKTSRVEQLAKKFELIEISLEEVRQLLTENQRSVFLCDVRTQAEFLKESWPARVKHTPGGQLIQATDQYIGVRGGIIVLCDEDGVRAPVVASWLKQLGWDVRLLKKPQRLKTMEFLEEDQKTTTANSFSVIKSDDLISFLNQNTSINIFDARPSTVFKEGSLVGAQWTIRPLLLDQVQSLVKGEAILLLGSNYEQVALLAQDLERNGNENIYVCVIDNSFITTVSQDQIVNEPLLLDADCIDYLFFVHDRHDGNKEAAKRYLEWETNLIGQLDEQERNTFLI